MQGTGNTSDPLRTERDRALRRCAILEETIDRIVQIRSGIIYILDADGRFTFVNNGVEAILHYRPEELLGKHFSVIMPPEEYERYGRERVLPKYVGVHTGDEQSPRLFDERRSGKRRTKDILVRLLAKESHDVKVFKGEVSGIMGSEGYYEAGTRAGPSVAKFIGSQGIIFDITEYQESENQRRDLERKMLEAQKFEAVGRLAGGAAHHFNNKLGSVLGFSELIRQRYSSASPELQSFLDHIVSATTQMADLTSQLLAFARQGSYQIRPVNLNKVVLDVCQIVTSAVRGGIRIKQNLDAHNPVVMGDESQIKNAVLNIAVNSCDAMPLGGDLTFETRIADVDDETRRARGVEAHPGAFVLCSVVDTGTGIEQSLLPRIFEPFFTTKDTGKGTGMGLASSYGCVRRHGGFIDVKSKVGSGTCFDLYLPHAADKEAADPSKKDREHEPLRGSGRVLIVDDDPDIRAVTAALLEDLGYSVVQSGSATEALAYCASHPGSIDCAVVDLVLPGIDGTTCCRRLKEVSPKMALVVSTGHAGGESLDELLRDGLASLIVKPFDQVKLSRKVYEAMHTTLVPAAGSV